MSVKDDNRWKVWIGMRQRCNNPNHINWKSYGGRGITYDPSWDSFELFCLAVGPRDPLKTLDRWPDKNGNYVPGNIRWATSEEQLGNRNEKSGRVLETQPRMTSKTGVIGVSRIKGRYVAQGMFQRKSVILYRGNSLEDATLARKLWEGSLVKST